MKASVSRLTFVRTEKLHLVSFFCLECPSVTKGHRARFLYFHYNTIIHSEATHSINLQTRNMYSFQQINFSFWHSKLSRSSQKEALSFYLFFFYIFPSNLKNLNEISKSLQIDQYPNWNCQVLFNDKLGNPRRETVELVCKYAISIG